MKLSDAVKLVALAAANFPGQQERALDVTAKLWHKLLGDLPYNVAEMALVKVLATARFWPTVAEIREAAASLMAPQLLTGGEAWAEVCEQMRRVGSYGVPEWSHPVIGRAVDAMGGWRHLCMSEEPMADRAHFLRIYDTLAARERETAVLPPAVLSAAQQIATTASVQALPPGGGDVDEA